MLSRLFTLLIQMFKRTHCVLIECRKCFLIWLQYLRSLKTQVKFSSRLHLNYCLVNLLRPARLIRSTVDSSRSSFFQSKSETSPFILFMCNVYEVGEKSNSKFINTYIRYNTSNMWLFCRAQTSGVLQFVKETFE